MINDRSILSPPLYNYIHPNYNFPKEKCAVGAPELVIDAKGELPEGPCWDIRKKVLYWVDIEKYTLNIYNPVYNTNRVIKTGQNISCVAPRVYNCDSIATAMKNGFYFLNTLTEDMHFITGPQYEKPTNRFNDGKCDAAGRFWAGTMNIEPSSNKGAGSLYCLFPDFQLRKAIGNVTISNGITWSPDNKVMYYIDSFAYLDSGYNEVWAFDYDINTGMISNKRVVVRVKSDGKIVFDGMTSDEEGMLWVAQFGGSSVDRFNPFTGELIESVKLPVSQVTSCIFGGEGLNELYITTAKWLLDQKGLASQPLAGGIFRVKTKVKGAVCFAFGG